MNYFKKYRWILPPAIAGLVIGFLVVIVSGDTKPAPPATSSKTIGQGIFAESASVSKPEPPKPKVKPVITKPVPKPQAAKPAEPVQVSNNILKLVNQVRTKAGRAPLTESSVLNGTASKSVQGLIASGRCSKGDICTHGNWQQWFAGAGFNYKGENIAACQLTDSELVNAWASSPTHYANMVSGNFTHFGVATAYGNFEGDFSSGKKIKCRYAVNHLGAY